MGRKLNKGAMAIMMNNLHKLPTEILKILEKQTLAAYNEAEKTLHEINRELERRGEK